ncbi:MAG: MarR family winged helix-turn-helix transcriptional regulator [Bradymonadia bacterium]
MHTPHLITPVDAEALASIIEQVGRAMYAMAFTDGLNPAQWAALRYFHRADDTGRTVSGFARFQGTTPGTASRTISVLIRRGYLTRDIDPADRRRALIGLTGEGHAMMDLDPMTNLTAALKEVSPPERGMVLGVMERLLHHLQQPKTSDEDSIADPSATHLSPAHLASD